MFCKKNLKSGVDFRFVFEEEVQPVRTGIPQNDDDDDNSGCAGENFSYQLNLKVDFFLVTDDYCQVEVFKLLKLFDSFNMCQWLVRDYADFYFLTL